MPEQTKDTKRPPVEPSSPQVDEERRARNVDTQSESVPPREKRAQGAERESDSAD